MTVQELYEKLGRVIERGKGDYEVRIITENSGYFGPRSSVGVKYASSGFDWESNQFNLVADEKIITSKSDTKIDSIESNSIQLTNLKNPQNPK